MPRNLIEDPPFAPVLLFDENRDFTGGFSLEIDIGRSHIRQKHPSPRPG